MKEIITKLSERIEATKAAIERIQQLKEDAEKYQVERKLRLKENK